MHLASEWVQVVAALYQASLHGSLQVATGLARLYITRFFIEDPAELAGQAWLMKHLHRFAASAAAFGIGAGRLSHHAGTVDSPV